MGVKGLFSMLEDSTHHSKIFQGINFREKNLLVDGNNLAYYLYRKSDLDQNHGGEYKAFEEKVQEFFNNLNKCVIIPYVMIGKGSGTSDIKRNTKINRKKNVLKRIPAALNGKKTDIFPPFTMTVFEQTLNDMKVSLVRCFGEANGKLAALAKEWSFPVLSGDTDFYIYDLPEGVLPLQHFQWHSLEKDNEGYYILCKQYTTAMFCTHFNIDTQLMPLFASLARNVILSEINWESGLMPADCLTKSKNCANLEGLLRCLEDQTTEAEALTAAMKQVQTELQRSLQEYELLSSTGETAPSSSLLEVFSRDTVPSLPAEMLSLVPEWVRALLARGDLGADLLMHKSTILQIQVESSDLQSSNLTSRPIRQVLYGLLLGQGGGEVEEVDRDGLELASVKVQPLVQGAAQTLSLDSLPQADHTVRKKVFLERLGVEEEALKAVPAPMCLPVAVTCYWWRMASPEPRLLKALLMVMVQGELIRQNGAAGGQQYNKRTEQLPDGFVAHSFNQWQACLKDASQLNLLLCKPLPEPHYAWLYQGRLVHWRQKQLQEREPEDIVQGDQFRRLYRRLLVAVTQPGPGANRRAGRPEGQLTASMEHLHLHTQNDQEEEEEGLEAWLRDRMRR
ncbi:unnamed protein product [Arctogadus glacialis]